MSDGSQFLMRVSQEPQARYGKRPELRTVEELLRWGVINLDKPSGPTSHQVVAWVKVILNIDKGGHGGTLDPGVTGVLPIALGRATKAVKVLLTGGKEYIGVMTLHRDVQRKRLDKIFDDFKGEIYQMPPVRSAVKRQLRTRRIYSSEIIEFQGRNVLFKVSCQAGTYIRTYCHDMGEALGVGAHMAQLRRSRTGPFLEEKTVTLHQLKDAYVYWKENNDEGPIRKIILPFERMFDHLPKVVIKDAAASAVTHGAPLAVVGIIKAESKIKGGELIAILSTMGEAVAFGRAQMSADEMVREHNGIAVQVERVLKDDSFPILWRAKGKVFEKPQPIKVKDEDAADENADEDDYEGN
jgi:H/ACA ribonucleoprotein complex subunit 4